jgi:hypothetical protein
MIKITKILNYGGACPFQIDALTDDNRRIYGKYRSGCVRVYVSRTGDLTDDGATDGDLYFLNLVGGEFDGYMSLEEFKKETKYVLDWSETN